MQNYEFYVTTLSLLRSSSHHPPPLICLQIDSLMESYERPKLCRLCRCPVADGGVPLSDIDRPKLSEWWLQHLDTQFEDEDGEKDWICQFCVCDARRVFFYAYSFNSFNIKNPSCKKINDY